MKKGSYQKLRLQEFNDFDVERVLKGVVDTLEEDNENREGVLLNPPFPISEDTIEEFSEVIQDNSAEIIRITSILTHTDDVYSYFSNGPLFRKDRDVK